MNPPPPGPGTPFISIYTLNMMFGSMLFAQGMLIFMSAWAIKDYKGVREAALATLAMSSGYLIIGLRTPAGGALPAYLVQVLTVCGYFMIHVAICKFVERPCTRWLMLGLAPLSLLALTFSVIFIGTLPPLKVIALITGAVVFLYTAWILYSSNSAGYRYSAVITSITLLILSLTLMGHLIASFFSIDVILPTGSSTEKIAVVTLFIASYLWTGGFILMISQRLQGDLHDYAMKDALTQVHNRRAMDHLLELEMSRMEDGVQDFSILLCDIDQFKHINDTYGHQIGDQVLQWFAKSLQDHLREKDVVARWGGEEFLLLLPETDLQEASQIAERLRKTIAAETVQVAGETIAVTFSGGVSSAQTSRDVRLLCKVADDALYVAKQTRNQVVTGNHPPQAAPAV